MSSDSPKSIMYRNATTTKPTTSPTSIDSAKYCPVRKDIPFPARRNFQLDMEIRLNMAASVENVGHETARDFHCDLLVGKGLEYDER